ncbi:MAG: serine/threonine-protein kinase [Planctomycetaceae bacterium]
MSVEGARQVPPAGPADECVEAALFGLPVADPASAAIVRDPVELATSDFLDELRQGLRPSLEVYLQRYPQYATRLREMLPLVAAMESWRLRHELAETHSAQPGALPLERLGEYRLVREIGRGGMGVVYEAVRDSPGQRVALKLLRGRFHAASLWRKRFYGEARTAARLSHHHIIPVYQFGEQEGWCYFTMLLIEGLGLDRVISLLREPAGAVYADDITRLFGPTATPEREATPTEAARVLRRDSWWQIAKIGMQVAAALRYAHRQGILHRDIKPANLLLDASGSVWVADFGMASNKNALYRRNADHLGGTLRYMAPEQFRGVVDERSDVYSLGVTLYELCTLQSAYDAADQAELLAQVRAARPRRPRTVNRRVPAELERIILKSMASDPALRFQSAGELLAALRPLVKTQAPGWLDPIGRLLSRGN